MPDPGTTDPGASPQAGTALLELIRRLARELRPGAPVPELSLDSALDAEAGIDSLGRMELFARLERVLGWHLDEDRAIAANTPRELLAAVAGTGPPAAPAPAPPRSPPAAPAHRIPAHIATLTEALAWHAEHHPERIHLHLYEDGGGVAISYGALLRDAEALAAGLGARGLSPGQPVALVLPTGADFFRTFLGILLAGGVPVPLYPPMRMAQIEEHLDRQAAILANAGAPFLITVPEGLGAARLLRARLPALRALLSPQELAAEGGRLHQRRATHDLALIQYTSGSTGDPKGVALRHANLLANIRAMGEAVDVRGDDVFVSWLPLYHDMGLIGAWLGSLYHGHPLVVMSPPAFVARPQRWLHALHEYRGTLSAAPNFAYGLCASRLTDEDLEGLDLSAWRVAFNGAEPVHVQTLERFIARFAPYGFRRNAMTPVYGLAECSVGLAFPPLGRGPLVDHVARDSLEPGRRVRPVDAGDPHASHVPACGRALPGHELRIVDDADRPLPERTVGRIQFRGPSATDGYYRNPQATVALFHDGWLDTGDYGYLADGEVRITGRAKELIIRAGRNLYPYDLERAVAELPGVRRNGVAVFASPDPATGEERLVVLAETRECDPEARERLRRRIHECAVAILEIPPDDVVLAAPRTVPKTSSGKIRRSACRELYERGALTRRRAVWQQLVRLRLAGLLPSLRRLTAAGGRLLYAGYAWTAFLAMAGLTLLATLAPRASWRIGGSRAAARALFRITGTRVHLRMLAPIPQAGALILVANHTSYLDGIVLWALLPTRYGFVAKRELRRYPLVRGLLERVGTHFVDRFDNRRSARDATDLTTAARAGARLLFFPEGTFVDAAGLQPFHMGAFVAAARAGAPVVPVAIRGTRAMLRGDEWFPRRGAVEITVGVPIPPPGTDWAAALALRDAARAEILRHCGEPDMQ
jgi:1-acyl-sn-glycerol-3-phosphate acyltransferase